MFDLILILHWPVQSAKAPTKRLKSLIWIASVSPEGEQIQSYERDPIAKAALAGMVQKALDAGQKILLGLSDAPQNPLSLEAFSNMGFVAPHALGLLSQQSSQKPLSLAQVTQKPIAQEVKAAKALGQNPASASASLLARAFFELAQSGQIAALLDGQQILGSNHSEALRAALPPMQLPPRLRNDTFAMPQGVTWAPVDQALARLKEVLSPVATVQSLPLAKAMERILAQDAIAHRSNPPLPNSAVDGYGFAHEEITMQGVVRLPLVAGRAAAGQPFEGRVPKSHALRILTGAVMPDSIDTVVLEEDCAIDVASITFDGPIKVGANTRKAGEDVVAGTPALAAGHKIRAPDLALLASLGIASVMAYRPLRVGVLSTGDEIIPSAYLPALPHQIYDANRPMLLGLAKGWGYEAVDLGHQPDRPRQITRALDRAAKSVDVILTSGGASAGDEDHVSRLLSEHGHLTSWRIAMKPGRPLALALWQGVPVIGLPGNPVAALVCALIFGYPALSRLAGGEWPEPQGFWLPAAFFKRKKAGRREYLRAKLTEKGKVEIFGSEGSGRISGLSWANGLVELPDEAVDISPGDLIRFLPYSSFGVT